MSGGFRTIGRGTRPTARIAPEIALQAASGTPVGASPFLTGELVGRLPWTG
jgi:hypothetical protein